MARQESLFDRAPATPTTRQIATLVQQGGIQALVNAELRADAAAIRR